MIPCPHCSGPARVRGTWPSALAEVADIGLSHQTVSRLLVELGYSLQANRKTLEGQNYSDRDAQFEHINRKVRSLQRRGQPVVSVDTMKKELIGNYKNPGQELGIRAVGPRPVKSKDFPYKVKGFFRFKVRGLGFLTVLS